MIPPFRFVVEEVARASGKIHIPVKNRQLTAADGLGLEQFPDGTVLLGHSNWYLCNTMIPGFWKHAAIKVGDHAVEAVTQGVVDTPLSKWAAERDFAAALVPIFGDPDGMAQVAALVEKQLGKPYDWEFDIGSRAFYCAELVYWAYRAVYPLMAFELRERLGRLTVTPQDFYDAKSHWQLQREIPGSAKDSR